MLREDPDQPEMVPMRRFAREIANRMKQRYPDIPSSWLPVDEYDVTPEGKLSKDKLFRIRYGINDRTSYEVRRTKRISGYKRVHF